MAAVAFLTPAHVLDLATHARCRVLRKHLTPLGADAAWSFMLVRGEDGMVRMHACTGVADQPDVVDAWEGGDGLPMVLTEADPEDLPPVGALVEPPASALNQRLWRWAVPDLGFRAAYFASFVDGAEHRGGVCFVRREPGAWSPPRAALSSAVTDLARVYRSAWTQERDYAPPRGALDVDAVGRVSGGRTMCAWAERVKLGEWVRRAGMCRAARAMRSVPGAFVRVTPHAQSGATLSFDPVSPMVLPPVLLTLTPALRRIVSLAANGATVSEMAEHLGRSPETVREHIARVYDRLGIGSRAELASAARRMLI